MAAPRSFARLEKLMRQEFGVPLRQVFSDSDERAFAAASIGQVHRARTVDGADVEDKHNLPSSASTAPVAPTLFSLRSGNSDLRRDPR